ncbi:MAG: FAD-binding oxidoreductase [Thaumarchaeota archaeon]|nr:MAG: FAD-binding oxidoreductase [Nitrososphaerota archaeon]
MPVYDLVVVGAGIMGLASAYYLKLNNPSKSVLVLDRFGAPGQGNTGRSNAMFRNTFTSSDNQLLANTSIDFYLHLQNELKLDIGLQLIGYLWLLSESQVAKTEGYVQGMKRNGIEVEEYSVEELRRLVGGVVTNLDRDDEEANVMGLEDISGAVFGPKCGRLDPEKLVRFYANEFMRLGGKIAFKTNVEGLLLGPSRKLGVEGEPFVWQEAEVKGVRVAGGISGEIEAKSVVVACGAWNNELLEPIGVDGHVKAKKRQLFSVSAENDGPLLSLLHTRGFNNLGLIPLVILPKSGVHFKPVSEERKFWVACEDEVNRPYINIPDRDLDSYRAEPSYYERGVHPVLAAYFPQFRNARPESMWAGLYAYNTVDYLPYAFREGNLIVVGGDSGSGIMKGDALGRIVDALYREGADASLYGGVEYGVSKVGFERRDVKREEWVI